MANRIKEKNVIIKSFGIIDMLNGAIGPILSPMRLDIETIMHLVNTGKEVYEVSDDRKKEVRLTIRNYNKPGLLDEPKKEEVKESVAAPQIQQTEQKESVVEEVPVEKEKQEQVKYYNNENKNRNGKNNKNR